MYKLCKTEQSAARQRELELGLQQLMLTKRYEDITISDLCDRLQVPRKSFYRYFSGKDGALFALMDHTMLEFYDLNFHSKDSRNPAGDLENYFTFWYDHRNFLEALERSHLSGILVERATTLAQKERLIPDRILNWPMNLQNLALSFAVCGLMSMVIQWHYQGYRVSPTEMAQMATVLLTQPLIQD